MNKTLQIEIESLTFNRPNLPLGAEDVFLVNLTAIYPAPGKEAVVTTKSLKAQGPLPSADDFSRDFAKRIVMKGDFRGVSQLKVECVAVNNPKALEKLFLGSLKIAATVALGDYVSGIKNVILGKVIEGAGDSLFGMLDMSGQTTYNLGEASIMIDPDAIDGSSRFVRDLVVDEEETRQGPARVNRHGNRPAGAPVVVVPAGKNGAIILTAKTI